MKNSNLLRLLDNTPQAYYWIGFLIADGHFSAKRLHLVLAQKDRHHVERFSRFVESRVEPFSYKKSIGIRFMDSNVIPKLRKKFGICNNKTHNPCKIDISDRDLFLAFLIGFIDGDGCICKNKNREDSHIKIKCHSSWLANFESFRKQLSKILQVEVSEPKINKQGYANWNITNTAILRTLKLKTQELDLPVLQRKWNRINESYISRQEKGKERIEQVRILLADGVSKKEIARQLGVAKCSISQIIKRNNL
jgi:intein/homing endonuclease